MKLNKLTILAPALLIAALATAQQQSYVNTSGYMNGQIAFAKKAESQPATGTQYYEERFMPAKINGSDEIVVVRHNAYSDEIEVKVHEEIRVVQPVEGLIVKLAGGTNTSYEYQTYVTEDNLTRQNFLIVVSDNPNLKIYRKDRITLIPEQHPTGGYQKYKAASYKKLDPEYYIKLKDGKIVYFDTKKSEILSMFPAKQKEIKAFIKENKISTSEDEGLAKLGTFLNTII